jgi:hypothetical protein
MILWQSIATEKGWDDKQFKPGQWGVFNAWNMESWGGTEALQNYLASRQEDEALVLEISLTAVAILSLGLLASLPAGAFAGLSAASKTSLFARLLLILLRTGYPIVKGAGFTIAASGMYSVIDWLIEEGFDAVLKDRVDEILASEGANVETRTVNVPRRGRR